MPAQLQVATSILQLACTPIELMLSTPQFLRNEDEDAWNVTRVADVCWFVTFILCHICFIVQNIYLIIVYACVYI